MAFDQHLAERIGRVLHDQGALFQEKKMMGGLAFMVDEKMCVGVVKQSLMARIGPEVYASALSRIGVRAMDFTGRPMKGYVFVDPEGTDLDRDLEHWVKLALAFNPMAKASGKRK